MKKGFLICLCAALLMFSGCVVELGVDEPSGRVTSGSVFIPEIAPAEGQLIARLAMGGDASYTVEVTTETDCVIWSALHDVRFDTAALSTTLWRNWFSTRERPYVNFIPNPDITWHDIPDGFNFLYVGGGSQNALVNVTINITGTGADAKIEFLR